MPPGSAAARGHSEHDPRGESLIALNFAPRCGASPATFPNRAGQNSKQGFLRRDTVSFSRRWQRDGDGRRGVWGAGRDQRPRGHHLHEVRSIPWMVFLQALPGDSRDIEGFLVVLSVSMV